jgi:hypothetical protein
VDITVYLPDELGQRAKREAVNLSRMLRDALADEFQRRDAMATAEHTLHLIDLEDEDGHIYKGRITGSVIATADDTVVFSTDDERVIVYESDNLRFWEAASHDDPEGPEDSLRFLPEDEYRAAMSALGITPVVDI